MEIIPDFEWTLNEELDFLSAEVLEDVFDRFSRISQPTPLVRRDLLELRIEEDNPFSHLSLEDFYFGGRSLDLIPDYLQEFTVLSLVYLKRGGRWDWDGSRLHSALLAANFASLLGLLNLELCLELGQKFNVFLSVEHKLLDLTVGL